MKKPIILLGPTLVLTVLLYLLAYYLLPGPAPSAALVLLFAGVSLGLVWIVQRLASRRQPGPAPQAARVPKPDTPETERPKTARPGNPSTPHPLLLLVLGATLALPAYSAAHAGQTGPPAITCAATPRRLTRGQTATIATQIEGHPNQPLKFAYSASAGRISGSGSKATLTTTNAAIGRITVHCSVVDDQGRTASATTSVLVLAPGYDRGQDVPRDCDTCEAAPAPAPPAAAAPRPPPASSSPQPVPAPAPMPSPPPASVSAPAPLPIQTASATVQRVSGSATLLTRQSEESGYGLYSYALFSHEPGPAELPRYKAFLAALLRELPLAAELEQHIPRRRINVTYIPVKLWPATMSDQPHDVQAAYMLAHYDYARAAAMLASLPQRPGPGPVITSTLSPLSYDSQPHPVLVQDLSKAQPALMADYVDTFKNQVAAEHFWQPSTLADFALSLRNLLETAAVGLGMSQDAVSSWVRYLK